MSVEVILRAPGSLRVFFFQAEDGIRDLTVTGVQTCALPIFVHRADEAHHELVRGMVVELARRRDLLDAALVHDDDRVCELERLLLVVRDEDRRSEEHTSELQSQSNLVCRLLLEKKNTTTTVPAPFHLPGHVHRTALQPVHRRPLPHLALAFFLDPSSIFHAYTRPPTQRCLLA